MATSTEIRAQISALEAELRKQEEAEAKAARKDDAIRAIALLAAMKSAKAKLDKVWPELWADEKWEALNKMAGWPRTTAMKKAADLSETEMHSAQEAGEKAVAKL